jgi:hypothetical protein
MTPKQINRIEELLRTAELSGFGLRVEIRQEGEWYFVPVSADDTVDLFDYAPKLYAIEKKFEDEEGKRLLLVPAL